MPIGERRLQRLAGCVAAAVDLDSAPAGAGGVDGRRQERDGLLQRQRVERLEGGLAAFPVTVVDIRVGEELLGTVKCVGTPEATSGANLTIVDAGWPLSGIFIIKETTHSFDPGSGYTTSITYGSDSLPPGHERYWGAP